MDQDVIQCTTRTAIIAWYPAERIVRLTYRPEPQTLADAQENTALVEQITNGQTQGLLIDGTQSLFVSRDALAWYANHNPPGTKRAVALIAQSSLSAIMGNIFMRVNRPRYPTKLFTDEQAALAWLQHWLKTA